MGWAGFGIASGIFLMILSGLGLLAGVLVLVEGPAFMEDMWGPEYEEADAEMRAEGTSIKMLVRGVGLIVAAVSAVVLLLGGLLYGIGRGVVASRPAAAPQAPVPPPPSDDDGA